MSSSDQAPPVVTPSETQVTIASPREMTSIAATCYQIVDTPSGLETSFAYFGGIPLRIATVVSVTILPIGVMTGVLRNRESFLKTVNVYLTAAKPRPILDELRTAGLTPTSHMAMLANAVNFAVSPFSGSVAFAMLPATRLVNAAAGDVLNADPVIQVNFEPRMFAHFYVDLLAAADRIAARVATDYKYLADALPELLPGDHK